MAKRKQQPDWIIIHDGTQGDLAYAFSCLRCGNVQKITLPIEVDCYVAMGKAYVKSHRKCKAAEAAEGE